MNKLLAEPGKYNTKVFCPYCCYGFCKNSNGKRNLAEHRIYCRSHGAQRTKFLPHDDNFIGFKEYEKMQKVPFCIYADFETNNKQIKGPVVYDANDSPLNSGMTLKTNHEVSGFCFYTVSSYFPPTEDQMLGKSFLNKFKKRRLGY